MSEQPSPLEIAVQALTKIAEHRHCSYDHPSNGPGLYGVGCADGHRCAAQIARAALHKINEGRR